MPRIVGIDTSGVPIGHFVDAGYDDVLPPGTLLCDGSLVSRTTYALLFAAIGTAWGAGDGSITFALPDFRGKFRRGRDHGAGNDPDAASRAAQSTGGAVGDAVGSVQAHEFASHTHTEPIYGSGNSPSCGGANGTVQISLGHQTGAAGGNETRPLNAYVNIAIAYI